MIRDFQLRISYRLAFFLRVLSILIIVTIAYYVSQIFLGKAQLASWRDPLAAWITGLAVLNYFMTNFSSLATAIRSEQLQGTLESVLMTPISVPGLIVASSTLDFIRSHAVLIALSDLWRRVFWVTYEGSYLLAFSILILRQWCSRRWGFCRRVLRWCSRRAIRLPYCWAQVRRCFQASSSRRSCCRK